MKLTEAQQAAVGHSGCNLQLIACAGSGKTEVVARRVAHMLANRDAYHLEPRNIVAFTFTEKAAGELKDRIVTRVRESMGHVTGMAEMYVGTIHAFCLDLLRTELPEFLKYNVLNEVQQILFVDRNSKKSGLTVATDLKGDPLRRYVDTPRYINALNILREARLAEEALENCTVRDGLADYERLLTNKCYLDYSGILLQAVMALAENERLQKRIFERVRYVICDEYQDVNPIQECVIQLLHDGGAEVCVVGDDDQTIYQWRGSDIRNILNFEDRYRPVEPIRLQENFRSSPAIVELARDFISQNGERLEKAMVPTEVQDYEPGDIVALSLSLIHI